MSLIYNEGYMELDIPASSVITKVKGFGRTKSDNLIKFNVFDVKEKFYLFYF